ncbi:MAG: hypothetical protein GMKNLPBB_01672 [Myxococcota bacterium]|nr:hypothetical protein [Myxococcota bacterium]
MAKVREPEPLPDLNLTPMMNLVCMIIPFLLLGASFVEYKVINVSASMEADGGGGGPSDEKENKPKLGLVIGVGPTGYYIIANLPGFQQSESKKIPKKGADYDTATLRKALHEIYQIWHKQAGVEEEHGATLSLDDNVPYEVIIQTMDAARYIPGTETQVPPKMMFDGISLAGGFQAVQIE